MLVAGCLVAVATAGTPLAPASAKVDPALTARLQSAADGRAPFLVVLQEQADLSPASQLLDKKAKGAFVFAALRETSARTQKPLVTQLQAREADCRPFWIMNAVSAQGDAAAVAMAAARDDVRGVLADLAVPTDLAGQHPDPSKAPDVMNNSWGFTVGEGATNVNMLKFVVETCRAAGIVVVVSVGNSGPSAGSVSDSPAIYAASFTVGATDANDTIAGFSSRGPVTLDGSGRRKPDVCAPGVSVRSCIRSGYASLNGTSMAGPQCGVRRVRVFQRNLLSKDDLWGTGPWGTTPGAPQ